MTRRRRKSPPGKPFLRSGFVHAWGIEHGKRWIVTADDDVTPISRHRTRAEAETAARAHAATFGYRWVIVHELDGEETHIEIPDPDLQPPYPGAAKGAPAG
jgi:hypothetical protein